MNAATLRFWIASFCLALGLSFVAASLSAQEFRPDLKKFKLKEIEPKLTFILPDLYVAGTPDLTDITDTRPLSERMWVRVGNKGKAAVAGVRVHVYFWGLKKDSSGKIRGKIIHTRVMTIPSLSPGQIVKLYPVNASVPGGPLCWSVKVDPFNSIRELREDNNRTGRLWATYPDAFLRAYEYEAAP